MTKSAPFCVSVRIDSGIVDSIGTATGRLLVNSCEFRKKQIDGFSICIIPRGVCRFSIKLDNPKEL